ncbi:MAG TPA: hypothetical protein VEU11_18360 [Terriglobales bacterium]|nr:hypothetical protein [Terriglobales bacterium]
MTPDSPRDWKHLAEKASNEMNSEKLMDLVDELNRLLGEHEDRSRQQRRSGNQG